MNQTKFHPKIDAFWKWFIQMEEHIVTFFEADVDDERASLIERVNNEVLEFGLFAWEISPGTNKPFRFTLSPNGDANRLALSKLIISEAPSRLRNWEFYASKPAKDWDYILSVYDDWMIERPIEAFRWQYVLLEYSDDTFELLVQAKNIQFMDEESQTAAIDQVLNNIVGEECNINYFNEVSIVDKFPPEYQEISAPIRELKEHFDEILAEWQQQV